MLLRPDEFTENFCVHFSCSRQYFQIIKMEGILIREIKIYGPRHHVLVKPDISCWEHSFSAPCHLVKTGLQLTWAKVFSIPGNVWNIWIVSNWLVIVSNNEVVNLQDGINWASLWVYYSSLVQFALHYLLALQVLFASHFPTAHGDLSQSWLCNSYWTFVVVAYNSIQAVERVLIFFVHKFVISCILSA